MRQESGDIKEQSGDTREERIARFLKNPSDYHSQMTHQDYTEALKQQISELVTLLKETNLESAKAFARYFEQSFGYPVPPPGCPETHYDPFFSLGTALRGLISDLKRGKGSVANLVCYQTGQITKGESALSGKCFSLLWWLIEKKVKLPPFESRAQFEIISDCFGKKDKETRAVYDALDHCFTSSSSSPRSKIKHWKTLNKALVAWREQHIKYDRLWDFVDEVYSYVSSCRSPYWGSMDFLWALCQQQLKSHSTALHAGVFAPPNQQFDDEKQPDQRTTHFFTPQT